MAKRKRLSPAALTGETDLPADLETKAENGWVGVRPRTTRAPIAEVSGEAAAQSALEEVAGELRAARAEGRMVVKLPLAAVEAGHLVRDRLALDPDEMAALKASLRDRGQQTPIEVTDLGQGRYGLISGWRRLSALRALAEEAGEETGEETFGFVQALIRTPGDAAEAYRAMVEENEIRADLSFYERARIAVQAVGQGIHPDTKTAVQSLFSAARAPKRSKILAFTTLVETLDTHLRFPTAIPEKLGLRLVQALHADPTLRRRLTEALRKAAPESAEAERTVLDRALKAPSAAARPNPEEVAPGVTLKRARGRLTLLGRGVVDRLAEDLRRWLAARS